MGDGRRQRGLDRIFGHQQGVKAVREVIETAAELRSDFLPFMLFQTKIGEDLMKRFLL